jgi:hypothetical protein
VLPVVVSYDQETNRMINSYSYHWGRSLHILQVEYHCQMEVGLGFHNETHILVLKHALKSIIHAMNSLLGFEKITRIANHFFLKQYIISTAWSRFSVWRNYGLTDNQNYLKNVPVPYVRFSQPVLVKCLWWEHGNCLHRSKKGRIRVPVRFLHASEMHTSDLGKSIFTPGIALMQKQAYKNVDCCPW